MASNKKGTTGRPSPAVTFNEAEQTRSAKRLVVRRRRARGLLLQLISFAVVLGVLVAQPTTGNFSAYEDPRAGGVAWEPGAGVLPIIPNGHSDDDGGPLWVPLTGEGEAQVPVGAGGEGGVPDGEPAPAGGYDGEPEGGPVLYVVRAGDTLSGISSRYGVSVSDLWIANRLRNPHSLTPGQSLVIPSGQEEVFGNAATGAPGASGSSSPPPDPVYHRVATGENLWVIARRYSTTVAALCDANGMSPNELLHPGQRLEVTGVATTGQAASTAFLPNWPVYGTITSPFGMRNGKMHEGLDIAAPRGTQIFAAASGTVASAGSMGNYGRALIIDHGNGMSTLYAHCDRLLVTRGQRVTAGQNIALVGSTGRSTGPHLHFEVIVNGRRRDPLSYLWGS